MSISKLLNTVPFMAKESMYYNMIKCDQILFYKINEFLFTFLFICCQKFKFIRVKQRDI